MAGRRGLQGIQELRSFSILCHAVVAPIAGLCDILSIANMRAGNTTVWAAYVLLPLGIILTLLYGVLASSIWLERISRREMQAWQDRECRLQAEMHQLMDTTQRIFLRMPPQRTD